MPLASFCCFYFYLWTYFLQTGFILFVSLTLSVHKKWSFPLRISSVNVTKSAGICGFGNIYWSNPYWKTSFLVHTRRLFTTGLISLYSFLEKIELEKNRFFLRSSNFVKILCHMIHNNERKYAMFIMRENMLCFKK